MEKQYTRDSDYGEINFVQNDPAYEVTIEFPNDLVGIRKTLNWVYNSGDFMNINMTDDQVDQARLAGITITKKETDI